MIMHKTKGRYKKARIPRHGTEGCGLSSLYFDGNLHLVSEGEYYAPRVAGHRMVDRRIPERWRKLRNNLVALK
jgi:hypothetical protein